MGAHPGRGVSGRLGSPGGGGRHLPLGDGQRARRPRPCRCPLGARLLPPSGRDRRRGGGHLVPGDDERPPRHTQRRAPRAVADPTQAGAPAAHRDGGRRVPDGVAGQQVGRSRRRVQRRRRRSDRQHPVHSRPHPGARRIRVRELVRLRGRSGHPTHPSPHPGGGLRCPGRHRSGRHPLGRATGLHAHQRRGRRRRARPRRRGGGDGGHPLPRGQAARPVAPRGGLRRSGRGGRGRRHGGLHRRAAARSLRPLVRRQDPRRLSHLLDRGRGCRPARSRRPAPPAPGSVGGGGLPGRDDRHHRRADRARRDGNRDPSLRPAINGDRSAPGDQCPHPGRRGLEVGGRHGHRRPRPLRAGQPGAAPAVGSRLPAPHPHHQSAAPHVGRPPLREGHRHDREGGPVRRGGPGGGPGVGAGIVGRRPDQPAFTMVPPRVPGDALRGLHPVGQRSRPLLLEPARCPVGHAARVTVRCRGLGTRGHLVPRCTPGHHPVPDRDAAVAGLRWFRVPRPSRRPRSRPRPARLPRGGRTRRRRPPTARRGRTCRPAATRRRRR